MKCFKLIIVIMSLLLMHRFSKEKHNFLWNFPFNIDALYSQNALGDEENYRKTISVIINMTINKTNGPKMRQTHIIFLQWPVVVALANYYWKHSQKDNKIIIILMEVKNYCMTHLCCTYIYWNERFSLGRTVEKTIT